MPSEMHGIDGIHKQVQDDELVPSTVSYLFHLLRREEIANLLVGLTD
jgi:hypothetical protein